MMSAGELVRKLQKLCRALKSVDPYKPAANDVFVFAPALVHFSEAIMLLKLVQGFSNGSLSPSDSSF